MTPMAKQPNALPQLTLEEMTPPPIQPVPAGVKRPRWSVMIPTYNCARFLRETLESVISQDIDPAEMQIEVIDDCSTSDDPEAVVREFGQGRVSFYRKPANAGAIANFNTCIERSTGEYVHILHGDDYVKQGFYREINQRVQQYGSTIKFYTLRCFVVDERGELISLTPRLQSLKSPTNDPSSLFLSNPIRTPGCVINREFYEQHGGFLEALVHTADWEMWVRATALGKALFINEPLATYRQFDGNDTGRLAIMGENLIDYYRLCQVFSCHYEVFPRNDFILKIIDKGAHQVKLFQASGEVSAALTSSRISQAISKELPSGFELLTRRFVRKVKSMLAL